MSKENTYTMSNCVSKFTSIADKFMNDMHVNLFIAFRDENGNVVLRGAFDPCTTLITDIMMED